MYFSYKTTLLFDDSGAIFYALTIWRSHEKLRKHMTDKMIEKKQNNMQKTTRLKLDDLQEIRGDENNKFIPKGHYKLFWPSKHEWCFFTFIKNALTIWRSHEKLQKYIDDIMNIDWWKSAFVHDKKLYIGNKMENVSMKKIMNDAFVKYKCLGKKKGWNDKTWALILGGFSRKEISAKGCSIEALVNNGFSCGNIKSKLGAW
eukprot:CAMPEP_0194399130 /NCGR_PEP_ID=MMETSP0174-20130528/126490_1 /TAXON_ID=216777 /ORGANISM="Proboscia alata, Strain PI-D3" /LENGTH=201 /DNA_ID=CAMNT_0039195509 /DNA_START=1112 /DNA_END=1714 /DNA_ORIENTATION=+